MIHIDIVEAIIRFSWCIHQWRINRTYNQGLIRINLIFLKLYIIIIYIIYISSNIKLYVNLYPLSIIKAKCVWKVRNTKYQKYKKIGYIYIYYLIIIICVFTKYTTF